MKIDISYDHRFLRFPRRETIRTITSVLLRERKKLNRVSVVYTNNRHIRFINGRHLKHHFVTDVITFELEPRPNLETEIYINLDRARIQAEYYGGSFADETRRLLVHGLLHALGFDDKSQSARDRMRREENVVLEQLSKEKK